MADRGAQYAELMDLVGGHLYELWEPRLTQAEILDRVKAGFGVAPDSGEPGYDPLEKALSLSAQAFGAKKGKDRIRLAQEALTHSADCPYPYIVLSREEAKTTEEKIALLEKAGQAAKRLMGADFEALSGRFGDYARGRAYMYALQEVPTLLWKLDRFDEGIALTEELLRVDVEDALFIRPVLLAEYLSRNRLADAKRFCELYAADTTAHMSYLRALVLFMTEGDTVTAQTALLQAIENNPSVLQYLMRLDKMSKRIPEIFEPGSDEEAQAFVAEYAGFWWSNESACQWMHNYFLSMVERRNLASVFPGLTSATPAKPSISGVGALDFKSFLNKDK